MWKAIILTSLTLRSLLTFSPLTSTDLCVKARLRLADEHPSKAAASSSAIIKYNFITEVSDVIQRCARCYTEMCEMLNWDVWDVNLRCLQVNLRFFKTSYKVCQLLLRWIINLPEVLLKSQPSVPSSLLLWENSMFPSFRILPMSWNNDVTSSDVNPITSIPCWIKSNISL